MKNLIKVTVVAAGIFLAGTASAQQKLGHINSTDLLQSMPEVKTADASFQTYQKQKQTELEKMDAERQKKITTYGEKTKSRSEANKDVVDKEIQALVTEIQDLEKRITEADQKAQQELTAKREELFAPILQKAEVAVRSVAKEKGYAYVFDTTQPGFVYFDGGDDIIALVKSKLGISATASATPAATAPAAAPKK